jgi:hypothetical protein
MTSNVQTPAGFTAVTDPAELAAIEGGNFLGNFFKAIGDAANAVGDWINKWF